MTWNDLMESFVYENLDRNVKNILKHYPELGTAQPDARLVNVSFLILLVSAL